jgi:hypothetical protein
VLRGEASVKRDRRVGLKPRQKACAVTPAEERALLRAAHRVASALGRGTSLLDALREERDRNLSAKRVPSSPPPVKTPAAAAEKKAAQLAEKAVHAGTPEEEARTAALAALRLAAKHGLKLKR